MAAWQQASATDAARQIQCQRWSNKRLYCNIDVFCRNNRRNISGTIMIFQKKNFFLDLVKDWAIRNF
jgi:hypothetical protein